MGFIQPSNWTIHTQAELVGGTWHLLLENEATTAVADKYSTAPFRFYLVVVRLLFGIDVSLTTVLARPLCQTTTTTPRPLNMHKNRTPSSSLIPSHTTTKSCW